MRKTFLLILTIISISLFAGNEKFTKYKLENGLTVYLWEDKNQADVTGRVVVRAGSIDEPKEYTGLAHYLEHVLFKGTEKIGALNWVEEKPHYDNIVKLYDELAITTDQVLRDTVIKKINRESLAAGKYTVTSEFSNLNEGVIGGKGLNAGTSYDMTVYYNNFPAFQMEKWLEVNSERLIHPVFRSFQAELENVFEEYNMYQDNNYTHVNNFLYSNLYPTHPYNRDIIGTPDHLKNPRLSKLIEFFNTWYVPENMALVLVGNFNSADVMPLIKEKFGRLEAKKTPARVKYPKADFSSNPKYVAKLSYYPQVVWGYQGVEKGHKDELILDVCVQILSNSSKTGLLDKLSLDGDVQYASASNDVRRDDGRVIVMAIPYYDISQRLYESDKATEKTIMQEVDKLKNGTIEDWLIESVKKNLLRQYDLVLETPSAKTETLTELFAYNLADDEFYGMKNRINAITKEDIQRVAKQYLDGGHVTVSIEEGKPKKNKLKKPDIKPVEQPKGVKTEYAKYIQSISVNPVAEVYNNLNDVTAQKLYDNITLYRTENTENDIFTLTIRYGVGTKKMPKLEYAVSLMNSAGIMPSSDAQTVRRQFSELNARCSYSVTDDYLYISLIGDEKNLIEICKLMTRQTLMPKLDEKQLDRVKGGEIQNRLAIEKEDVETLSDALLEYAIYKEKSSFVDRLKLTDIYFLKISELTGEIIRATDYEADVHYVGKLPMNDVAKVLKENLPFKQGVKKSESPVIEERVTYTQPTIYFLSNPEAQQTKLYFYINGADYKVDNDVVYDAFYQYFSGGFNGLVMDEIREKNSMAYTANGYIVTPPLANKKTFFLGYIGTQGDKAADAISLYMNLLTNMPLYPERISDVKTYIKQTYLTAKPSFRSKSQVFNSWKQLGYNDDPAKINMSKVDNLTFDQIVDFYNAEIKGKPVTIVITGDPKTIDLKKIQTQFGKITKISSSTIFSKDE